MNIRLENAVYLGLKNWLDGAKTEVKKLENEFKREDLKRRKLLLDKEEAELNNKQDDLKKIEEQIEKSEAAINEIKNQFTEASRLLKDIQEKIDKQIEDIKQIPGMREHFEELINAKVSERYDKLGREQEELIGKKIKIESIQKLVTDNPDLATILKDIMNSKKEIAELRAELQSLKDDAGNFTDLNREKQIRSELFSKEKELDASKTRFLVRSKGHNVNDIEEKDLDELTEGEYVVDNKGNIDITATLNEKIESLNRKIDEKGKLMADYAIAYQIKQQEKEARENATKPKWWQFIKKFKNWNEKRKQKNLPESGNEQEVSNDFKESLKFDVDIVRDAVDREIETYLENARQYRRDQEARQASEQGNDGSR